ncbi:hypothetical protein FACS1894111_09440 [Clostridia bacterium]|nr:hypothetical protein FACS1894111_09440 [Clostridia bacterium]
MIKQGNGGFFGNRSKLIKQENGSSLLSSDEDKSDENKQVLRNSNRLLQSLFLLLLLLPILALTACSNSKEAPAYSLYYINKAETQLVPVAYNPPVILPDSGEEKAHIITEEEVHQIISDILQKLSEVPENLEAKQIMPKGVAITDWNLTNRQLSVYFNSDYAAMDDVAEFLCRAAMVRSITQFDFLDGVLFFVGDSPLLGVHAIPLGLMTADSFVENPGVQGSQIQKLQIVLYFANQEGTKLVKEVQDVYFDKSISMETLVMQHLLEGSKTGARATLPAATKLLKVQVLDNICFVNLSEDFLNGNDNIKEEVVIYSIVDSLAELAGINKVQISVNGNSNLNYRGKFSLNTIYERDLDYIEKE